MMQSGRKSDYIYGCTYSDIECAICKKKVYRDTTYKIKGFGDTKRFCCYRHMQQWKEEQQDRDRKRMKTVGRRRKSLEEWAEEYKVDYKLLWKFNMLERNSIPDSAYLAYISGVGNK